MTTSPDVPALSRLELLVLARLSAGKQPPTVEEIVDALEKYGEHGLSRGEWRQRLTALVEALGVMGYATRDRKLTPSGHARLRLEFGAHKNLAWRSIAARYAPTKIAGTSSDIKKLSGLDGGLLPAIVASELGMPPRHTLSALINDLVSKELGLPPGPVTLKRIQAHLIATRLGTEVALAGKSRTPDPKLTAARHVTKLLRVPAKDLEVGLMRRWIADDVRPNEARPASTAPVAVSPVPAARVSPRSSVDDQSFASLVNDAAHSVGPDGRFGDQKVFISAIWQQLSDRLDITLDELKQRLLAAQRKSLVSLARADIPSAMDQDLVNASEIADASSNFHFVIDAGRH